MNSESFKHCSIEDSSNAYISVQTQVIIILYKTSFHDAFSVFWFIPLSTRDCCLYLSHRTEPKACAFLLTKFSCICSSAFALLFSPGLYIILVFFVSGHVLGWSGTLLSDFPGCSLYTLPSALHSISKFIFQITCLI